MALETQDIRARSATTTSVAPDARSFQPEVSKLIDLSKCIGCKACQAACMEWNNLRDTIGTFQGAYTNPPDLDDQSWTVMKFNETEVDGRFALLIFKDGCLHCADPGCLRACPSPGAVVQYQNGIVDFQQDHCIGCGYCISGCPFNIPRLRKEDSRVYKCTLCSDRVAVGLEPACIKSCPTHALSFGSRAELIEEAQGRITDLQERGFSQAAVYNPPGVGGTHVFFVLPHGDRPEAYGLPKDPRIGPLLALWRSTAARAVGVLTMFSVLVAGILHYMRHGPLEVPEEGEGSAGPGAQEAKP
ncbi:MAG TPA: formate dehydrogenase subunit beta [Anaeromyxobacteraceae bacterium]|nr:formate dehydrogenase subunit beta [Anaeromyxobacteraceae bacterium]